MGTHTHHRVHENSVASNATTDKASRIAAITDVYVNHGILTDREVKNILGLDEMNSVRPTITIMLDSGRLVEVGKVRCDHTDKLVRLCKLSQLDVTIPRNRENLVTKLQAEVDRLKKLCVDMGMVLDNVASINKSACMSDICKGPLADIDRTTCRHCVIVRQARDITNQIGGME